MKFISPIGVASVLAVIFSCSALGDPDGDPKPVPVGAGSYAEFPPPGLNNGKIDETRHMQLNIDPSKVGAAVPTNHWFTDVITRGFNGNLWAYPLTVSANTAGIKVFQPTGWRGNDMVLDNPLEIKGAVTDAGGSGAAPVGADFAPKTVTALDWGDWTVALRLAQSDTQKMDVTLGRGMPLAWIECQGVLPVIAIDGSPTCTDESGAAVTFPVKRDDFCLDYGGRTYGIYAPDNTAFTQGPAGITATFATGQKGYLIVAALPSAKMLGAFHQYAYAIPRGSEVSWNYDPVAGEVATHWTVKTEALKGANTDTIQGWIPHHYREGAPKFAFNGIEYPTARGLLKCATGHEFEIDFPFKGMPPVMPLPQVEGFDEARMKQYLTEYAAKTDYGGDTYWGGKDLLCYARYMAMAKAMGAPEFDALYKTLATALADWYTYTPGEKEHYFAMYPEWKALVGFRDSYGSGQFNDQHFHYGYFALATAIMGMDDPDFLKQYGEMATLVAKEYANWDRSDTRFPFFRTFDLWEGHSWAGGTSSPNGENQESSSEAVQSWAGLFLLGAVMGNKEMEAAGAMGYSMETAAVNDYWLNYHGETEGPQFSSFSPEYKHPVIGILGQGGGAYATYFSGEPGWIYGIQWLPAAQFLDYLAKDPKFAKAHWQDMWTDEQADIDKHNAKGKGPPKQNTLEDMGGLATVLLGYEAVFDPDGAVKDMDRLWQEKNGAMTTDSMRGIIYWLAEANRTVGAVKWNAHTSIPTSTVYVNASTHQFHCVIYNPLPAPQTATVYVDGKPVGTTTVPGRALVDLTKLTPM